MSDGRNSLSHLLAWVGGGAVLVTAATVLGILALGSSSEPEVRPTNADQRDVVDAVETYVDAWKSADCEAYLRITTESEQQQAGITDCVLFDERAQAFLGLASDSDLFVTDIRGPWYQYTVTTRERFTVQQDPDGAALSQPQHVTVQYSYDVVPHDDGWAILWWHEIDLCDDWSGALTIPRGASCGSSDDS